MSRSCEVSEGSQTLKRAVLGRTGLSVSKLGFGGVFVNSNVTALDCAREAVQTAIGIGIDYFDTAPTYLDSEEVLGKVLGESSSSIILSTKLGGRPSPFDPKDKGCLMKCFEESLRLLNRDTIDILMIHEPDRPRQYDWWSDYVAVDGPVVEFLDDLKRQGLVKYTGLGGTSTTEMAHLCRSGKFDVLLTAFNYSLLWREAEIEVLPAAKENNMGIIVGSPLQQGALSQRFDKTIDNPDAYWLSKPRREQFRELYKLVDEVGIPLPELALRFVISNPDVHCVLMGARSGAEVEQNARAVESGPLSEAILQRLKEIADRVPFRPFGEPFGIGHLLPYPQNYRGLPSA